MEAGSRDHIAAQGVEKAPSTSSLQAKAAQVDDEADTTTQSVARHAQGRRPHWFRSTFFQITVLGVCNFLAPGLWAATAALGAGGQQTPQLVNAANSALFCCMVVTGLLTPALLHWTRSVKLTLLIGTLGYSPYAAALYCNSAFGTHWFIAFGAVLCGLSAGIFWAIEGAVVLTYPEKKRAGSMLAYWLMFRVLGQMVGGAINLGLNAKNSQAGSISTQTYLVFVALQACAPFVALLLSPPHKVQRKDGTEVQLRVCDSAKGELKQMARLLVKRKTLLLLPLFFQSTFSESLIGTYAVSHFTVRSRALGSFLSSILASAACYMLGFWLDWRRFNISTRYRAAYVAVYGMQTGWWVMALVLMNRYHRTRPTLDLGQAEWSRGFALYLLLQIGFNVCYEFVYAITMASPSASPPNSRNDANGNDDGADNAEAAGASDHSDELLRLASLLRASESAGQAVSYGINSTSLRLDAVAAVNLVLFALSLPGAWAIVRRVRPEQRG